jgi:hypothetical protein
MRYTVSGDVLTVEFFFANGESHAQRYTRVPPEKTK